MCQNIYRHVTIKWLSGLIIPSELLEDGPSTMNSRHYDARGEPSFPDLHSPLLKLARFQDEERSEGYEGDDHSPASRVRQRYEKMFKEREERGGMGGLDAEDEAARAAAAARDAANAAARTAFHGVISSVFTKHLR